MCLGKKATTFFKPGPNFKELLSTKICLAWNFFLDKNRITNKISICCIFLVTGIQLLFAYPKNHLEIWLVVLLLSRKKFHAKQILCWAALWNWAQVSTRTQQNCPSSFPGWNIKPAQIVFKVQECFQTDKTYPSFGSTARSRGLSKFFRIFVDGNWPLLLTTSMDAGCSVFTQ